MSDITSFLIPAATSRRRRKKPTATPVPAPVLVVETITTVTTASSTSVYTASENLPEEREIAMEDSKRKAVADEDEVLAIAPAPHKKKKPEGVDAEEEQQEEEEEELSYAQLKTKLRKTELALAQSKRSRVYTLPGSKQLTKWVEECPDFFEEVRGDAAAKSYKSRLFYMQQFMATAVIMMAQYGGDPARFALTVTVNARSRTETVDDEDDEDYGEEYELSPYALRLNLSQGNISFHQEGLVSGRSRYLYGNAPLNDQGEGILTACQDEFRVAPRAMLLLFAHCLEFIPLQTRRAYVSTLAPGSLMKEAMDVCHCFDEHGNKKTKNPKK